MDTSPVHRFTELRNNRPDLSDSMLLNSNNQTRFTGHADVVVAGAGIIGLCYAIHLKSISPHLKIEVFEKSPAPMQKIGESTLSSFTRFMNGAKIPQDYLLRLFGLKDGLQFYCIDRHGQSVTSEDVGGLDLSFQLDRRMSELFLSMWAQRMGINVYHGVNIGFEIAGRDGFHASTNRHGETIATLGLKNLRPTGSLKAPRVVLKDTSHSTGMHVSARLVCDATGFSRKLTSKFGNREKFDGWNCDAYWAYFKEKDIPNVESRLEHWDYPATKHVCFPEGWGWFIKLISWHKAPLGNLMDLVAYVIDNVKKGVLADEIPCTRDLSTMFNCPYEFITSIGFAVRNDYRLPECLDEYGATESERKFTYFQRRYPTLDRLLTGNYDLLRKYYGEQTYFVRKSMAYRSPIVAGEGWLAVGNSAGFTNPLISPGINAGIGSAFLAATLTEKILAAPEKDSKAVMQRSAEIYQAYVHDFAMPRLHQMNRMWYNMFRDHRLFEALVRCFWSLGVDAIDAHYEGDFTAKDLKWLVGGGGDDFQQFCGDVLAVMAPTDDVPLSKQAVEKVQELSHQCLSRRSKLYPGNKWGRYLRKYDDKLEKNPGKLERDAGARYFAIRCLGCKYWMLGNANSCAVCGTMRCSKERAL